MFENLYTPKEEKELKKVEKTAEISLQVAGDMARRCLSMEEFKVYRNSLARAEEGILDSLIAYNNHYSISEDIHITKYAMKVSRLLTKLETVRKLLRDIESGAKKGLGKSNEKHDD